MRTRPWLIAVAAITSAVWSIGAGFSRLGESGRCGSECGWMIWLLVVPVFVFPVILGFVMRGVGSRATRFTISLSTAGVAFLTLAVGGLITDAPEDPDRWFNFVSLLIMGAIGLVVAYALFTVANRFAQAFFKQHNSRELR